MVATRRRRCGPVGPGHRGPSAARRGALLGLLTGLAFFVPLLHWSGVYVGPVPWLLLAVTEAVFFALLGAALVLARRTPPLVLAMLTACLWVGQEALRGRLPYGGFPWGRLGFASADAPWLDLAGTAGCRWSPSPSRSPVPCWRSRSSSYGPARAGHGSPLPARRSRWPWSAHLCCCPRPPPPAPPPGWR